jgi:hypothetical protein
LLGPRLGHMGSKVSALAGHGRVFLVRHTINAVPK